MFSLPAGLYPSNHSTTPTTSEHGQHSRESPSARNFMAEAGQGGGLPHPMMMWGHPPGNPHHPQQQYPHPSLDPHNQQLPASSPNPSTTAPSPTSGYPFVMMPYPSATPHPSHCGCSHSPSYAMPAPFYFPGVPPQPYYVAPPVYPQHFPYPTWGSVHPASHSAPSCCQHSHQMPPHQYPLLHYSPAPVHNAPSAHPSQPVLLSLPSVAHSHPTMSTSASREKDEDSLSPLVHRPSEKFEHRVRHSPGQSRRFQDRSGQIVELSPADLEALLKSSAQQPSRRTGSPSLRRLVHDSRSSAPLEELHRSTEEDRGDTALRSLLPFILQQVEAEHQPRDSSLQGHQQREGQSARSNHNNQLLQFLAQLEQPQRREEMENPPEDALLPFIQQSRLSEGKGEEQDDEALRWEPSLAMREHSNHFSVTVELPGVRIEDVELEIDHDKELLVIQGRKRKLPKILSNRLIWGKNVVDVLNETKSGRFVRVVPLPKAAAIDTDHITATMKDGVLNIRLPKKKKREFQEDQLRQQLRQQLMEERERLQSEARLASEGTEEQEGGSRNNKRNVEETRVQSMAKAESFAELISELYRQLARQQEQAQPEARPQPLPQSRAEQGHDRYQLSEGQQRPQQPLQEQSVQSTADLLNKLRELKFRQQQHYAQQDKATNDAMDVRPSSSALPAQSLDRFHLTTYPPAPTPSEEVYPSVDRVPHNEVSALGEHAIEPATSKRQAPPATSTATTATTKDTSSTSSVPPASPSPKKSSIPIGGDKKVDSRRKLLKRKDSFQLPLKRGFLLSKPDTKKNKSPPSSAGSSSSNTPTSASVSTSTPSSIRPAAIPTSEKTEDPRAGIRSNEGHHNVSQPQQNPTLPAINARTRSSHIDASETKDRGHKEANKREFEKQLQQDKLEQHSPPDTQHDNMSEQRGSPNNTNSSTTTSEPFPTRATKDLRTATNPEALFSHVLPYMRVREPYGNESAVTQFAPVTTSTDLLQFIPGSEGFSEQTNKPIGERDPRTEEPILVEASLPPTAPEHSASVVDSVCDVKSSDFEEEKTEAHPLDPKEMERKREELKPILEKESGWVCETRSLGEAAAIIQRRYRSILAKRTLQLLKKIQAVHNKVETQLVQKCRWGIQEARRILDLDEKGDPASTLEEKKRVLKNLVVTDEELMVELLRLDSFSFQDRNGLIRDKKRDVSKRITSLQESLDPFKHKLQESIKRTEAMSEATAAVQQVTSVPAAIEAQAKEGQPMEEVNVPTEGQSQPPAAEDQTMQKQFPSSSASSSSSNEDSLQDRNAPLNEAAAQISQG